MRKLIIPAFIILFGSASFTVEAQTPSASPTATASDSGIKANLALGEVSAINQTDNKISLKTKDGAIDAVLTASTVFKKVPPENPKLSAATDASLSDIGEGDKILVTGNVAADRRTVPAKTIYIMTKADISKKISGEQQAWKTRGISGRIISLNPGAQEFTIAGRGLMGEQNVVVKVKENISYRRYAPDSVKFDDAKTSSFSELKVGDQIRALGDKSADNTTFQAERIVSGSFKMVGGTITAIDTAKNEITIKELQTNKPVAIVVNNSSTLKKFPVEMATMMAMRMQGGGMMRASRQGSQPAGQQPRTAPQGMQGGGGMRAGRGEFDDLLERFPTISLADLKVGDAIAISSSSNADASRYTAIKLVSGVEPFFRAPQNLAGARGGAAGGGQGGGTLNIPGLDGGIGTP